MVAYLDEENPIMRQYNAIKGTSLPDAIRNALAIAREHEEPIIMVFEGVPVVVRPDNFFPDVAQLFRAVNGLHVAHGLKVEHRR